MLLWLMCALLFILLATLAIYTAHRRKVRIDWKRVEARISLGWSIRSANAMSEEIKMYAMLYGVDNSSCVDNAALVVNGIRIRTDKKIGESLFNRMVRYVKEQSDWFNKIRHKAKRRPPSIKPKTEDHRITYIRTFIRHMGGNKDGEDDPAHNSF